MLTVIHCWDLQLTGLMAVSRGNLLYCRLRSCQKGIQGEYIALKITKMLEDWKIALSQVHVVIRDNGSNTVKAMTEANLPSFGCFAYSLQLVVNDGVLSQQDMKDFWRFVDP